MYDFDWWVVIGKSLGGWYCAKCGCRYCGDPMNGALAVLPRGSDELSLVTRINLPTRKLCNLIDVLKWINFIRTGNMNLAHDSLHNIESMLRDIQSFITADNDKVAKAPNEFGMSKFCCSAARLRIEGSSRF